MFWLIIARAQRASRLLRCERFMSIPGAASPLFLSTAAGGAAAGYAINRSLRFNSGDSAYLNRTPSSAGNRKDVDVGAVG